MVKTLKISTRYQVSVYMTIGPPVLDMSRLVTKPIRSDTNPAVKPHEMTRGLGGRGIVLST